MNLLEEFLGVVQLLESSSMRYALVGGLAVGIYVEPRATQDMDFLLHPGDWPRVVDVLSPLEWMQLAGPMDFANVRIRRLTKIEGADVMVIDFLLADGEYERELGNALRFVHQGQAVNVARPETLIRLKQGRMSDVDKVDIAALKKKLSENR
jgi:hypothetical protein